MSISQCLLFQTQKKAWPKENGNTAGPSSAVDFRELAAKSRPASTKNLNCVFGISAAPSQLWRPWLGLVEGHARVQAGVNLSYAAVLLARTAAWPKDTPARISTCGCSASGCRCESDTVLKTGHIKIATADRCRQSSYSVEQSSRNCPTEELKQSLEVALGECGMKAARGLAKSMSQRRTKK